MICKELLSQQGMALIPQRSITTHQRPITTRQVTIHRSAVMMTQTNSTHRKNDNTNTITTATVTTIASNSLFPIKHTSNQMHHSTEAYVTISPPSSVTIMVCSNWAQRLWSFVATVQPSSHTNVSPLPSTSIGSMVNTWSVRQFPSQQRTLHHLASPLVLEVEDVGKHVHVATDAVTTVITHARNEIENT